MAHPLMLALENLPRSGSDHGLSSSSDALSESLLHPYDTSLRHSDSFRLTLHRLRNDPTSWCSQIDTVPLRREDVGAYQGQVIHFDYSEQKMREDVAGKLRINGEGDGRVLACALVTATMATPSSATTFSTTTRHQGRAGKEGDEGKEKHQRGFRQAERETTYAHDLLLYDTNPSQKLDSYAAVELLDPALFGNGFDRRDDVARNGCRASEFLIPLCFVSIFYSYTSLAFAALFYFILVLCRDLCFPSHLFVYLFNVRLDFFFVLSHFRPSSLSTPFLLPPLISQSSVADSVGNMDPYSLLALYLFLSLPHFISWLSGLASPRLPRFLSLLFSRCLFCSPAGSLTFTQLDMGVTAD
ncbi:hypothetical protein C8J56DRAFT_1052912 [Mycena floridula]|nr:hypothetical protein C8J56DRAFT_1052912 [Mycena floridula]